MGSVGIEKQNMVTTYNRQQGASDQMHPNLKNFKLGIDNN